MNQQQRKYALDRVNSIVCAQVDLVKDKHTKKAVRLHSGARFQEFKAGRWVIKKGVSSISGYTDITDILDFTEECDEVKNDDAIDKDVLKIRKAASKVSDQIMLGDTEVALKLLEAFASSFTKVK